MAKKFGNHEYVMCSNPGDN
ncbi:unnamed protein product, partial [Rotaria magnacalcarata]